jgi:N-acyl homoserine lactone hydrolase
VIDPVGAVRGVAAFSTGRVQIHPQHAHGSRLPSLAWILFSPTWGDRRPIHVFVIEHDRGLVLFDTGQDLASLTDPDYYPACAAHAPHLSSTRPFRDGTG